MGKLPLINLCCLTFLGLWHHLPGEDSLESAPVQAVNGVEGPVAYVIGGEDADIANYPWMGALVFNDPDTNTRQFCGCTAIDPYWVLTAAHCVDGETDLTDFKIVFSTANLGDDEAGQIYYPSVVLPHPDYIPIFGRENDLALIQLQVPLPSTIPLLPLATSTVLERAGTSAKILGWGRISANWREPEDTAVLQEGNVEVVSLDFANRPEYFRGRVKNSMLPAGRFEPFASTGIGDSGGPLLAFNQDLNRWELIGITSFSDTCDKAENPITVFTRISTHTKWIEQIINQDFLHWTNSLGLASFEDDDGDDYSALMEYLFSMNPGVPDQPGWISNAYSFRDDPIRSIYALLRYRTSVPKFGLAIEKSTDLDSWYRLDFPWEPAKISENPLQNESYYWFPLVSKSHDPGFYRIRHEDYEGILHGPIPLGVGNKAYGIFNDNLDAQGPTRYDFLLQDLESDSQIRLDVRSDQSEKIRLQLIDAVTDIVFHDTTYDPPFNYGFVRNPNNPEVVRIESTQSTIRQWFEISTGFYFFNTSHDPGTRIFGSLTRRHSPYKRINHYAEAHRFLLQPDTKYLIELESEDLDPMFYLRDWRGFEAIGEVDNRPPGVTERYLFRPEETTDLEIIVSSWLPNDIGAYVLTVSEYTEPNVLRPERFVLGMIDPDDLLDEQDGVTFHINRILLQDLDNPDGYRVSVRGFDGLVPQLGVLNLTTRETLYLKIARCEDARFQFIPNPEEDYMVLVVASDRHIGKSFQVGLIPIQNENEQIAPEGLEFTKDTFTEIGEIPDEVYPWSSLDEVLNRIESSGEG